MGQSYERGEHRCEFRFLVKLELRGATTSSSTCFFSKQPKVLYALLSAATKTHNTLTRESSTGRGIDRHLMGLRLLLRSDLKESHPLFEDELFGKSQEWVLSTSGLSAGDRFYGTGFGAVYPNGYGINCEFSTSNLFL